MAAWVSERAIHILGAYGFIQEYPVEKYCRAVKLCTSGEGTRAPPPRWADAPPSSFGPLIRGRINRGNEMKGILPYGNLSSVFRLPPSAFILTLLPSGYGLQFRNHA